MSARATDIVVIGGSAGALNVLLSLLPAVPALLDVPIVVVLHLAPEHPSLLVELFAPRLPVPVQEAEDKVAVTPGLWFAPPGYHLLVEQDRAFALSVDEPVLQSRPSIDVLFESAARTYGAGTTALLLSGANRDGAAGVRAVIAAGGVAIAQHPGSAAAATMPEAGASAGAERWSLERIRSFLAALPAAAPNAG